MHNGCMLLLVGIMPWLVARPAYKARQQLFDGMNKYFAGNWRDDASALVSARYDAFKEHNVSVSVDTIARLEVGDIIAIMSNVVPAAFWVLNYIYADPLLLEKVRAEIDASSWSTSDEQTGGKTNHLNVKKVQEECKLLMATYQEVFRMQTFHVSSRSVVKDTMINDQYLLKKDSMVQIPGAVIHQDQDAWGLKAKFFNPLRFMGEQKHHAGAIRWFGGGATLCPGRHFAVAEIISFVAMFIMRFELTPVNYGWRIPEAEKASILSAIPPPSFDIEVLVETREGFEKDTWVFGDDA